ncbi:Hypothetical protein BJL86_0880 [Dietzia timorensis]|uniref:Uncharacterized protein n=1 Tax=Dietzia timorensis TaxID=499555 RepID=A0A173LJ69_9ACTN|nr:Hypothetical protein BJL86_0880 [Dietzia timorensis]
MSIAAAVYLHALIGAEVDETLARIYRKRAANDR